MKYRDYMNCFTVLDKSMLFERMQQRERQLRAASVPHGSPLPVAQPAEKKRRPLLLHPIRLAAIAMSVVLVATLTPILCIFLPKGPSVDPPGPGQTDPPGPGETDPPGQTFPYAERVKLSFMDDLMVDAAGVTAYGIRKETEKKAQASTISLLSAVPTAGEESETPRYNYLYSTSESYEAGNVEYDETGIRKVTFRKNTEISEEIYDENGELIDAGRTIEQEELDAQINRLYTTKQFTYLQFVAKVGASGYYAYKTENGEGGEEIELRPDDLTYDENGVSAFDCGTTELNAGSLRPVYYSSALSASFVIDNSTGYIYKIEDFAICGFHNGLVLDSHGYCYAVTTDEAHNLVFTDVLPNKDIEIEEVFVDNDGWVYVCNSAVEQKDADVKVIYFKRDKPCYVFGSDGNAYIAEDFYHSPTLKMVNGEGVPFENSGTVYYTYLTDKVVVLGMYENLVVMAPGYSSSPLEVAYDPNTGNGLWVAPETLYYWLDGNWDRMIVEIDGKLYYKTIDLDDHRNGKTTLTSDDLTPLGDNLVRDYGYEMEVGEARYRVNNVYRYQDLTETKYYQLVRTETGVRLEELTTKSYQGNVFILQPINK